MCEAHVRAIPFEALDPFLRRPVPIDLASLQKKIIAGRRGGYCFELSTLFQAALEAIGFAVTPLAARVRWMSAPNDPLGPLTHMLLKVETERGPQLADVGFGVCLIDAPLPLKAGESFMTPLGRYRLAVADGRFSLSAARGDGWRTMYVFDLQPQLPSDFVLSNWFTATHSAPPFQRFLMIERIVGAERRKLVNRRYIVEGRDGEIISERTLADADELGRVLDETFGIAPPAPAAEIFSQASK